MYRLVTPGLGGENKKGGGGAFRERNVKTQRPVECNNMIHQNCPPLRSHTTHGCGLFWWELTATVLILESNLFLG